MRFNEAESLAYLKDHGYEMKPSTFYKHKKKVLEISQKRRLELVSRGLWEQHTERINQLESAQKKQWDIYNRLFYQGKLFQASKVLSEIVKLQPLLSTYYHASQKVLEFDKTRGIVQPKRYLSVRGNRRTEEGSEADNE